MRLFDKNQPGQALSKKNHSFLGMVEGYEAHKSSTESQTQAAHGCTMLCAAGGDVPNTERD